MSGNVRFSEYSRYKGHAEYISCGTLPGKAEADYRRLVCRVSEEKDHGVRAMLVHDQEIQRNTRTLTPLIPSPPPPASCRLMTSSYDRSRDRRCVACRSHLFRPGQRCGNPDRFARHAPSLRIPRACRNRRSRPAWRSRAETGSSRDLPMDSDTFHRFHISGPDLRLRCAYRSDRA